MSKASCPIDTPNVSFYANHFVIAPRSMHTIFQSEVLLNTTITTSLSPLDINTVCGREEKKKQYRNFVKKKKIPVASCCCSLDLCSLATHFAILSSNFSSTLDYCCSRREFKKQTHTTLGCQRENTALFCEYSFFSSTKKKKKTNLFEGKLEKKKK